MSTESKKYEFTGETKMYFGRTLRQIRAIVDDFCEKVIETHRDNAYEKEYIAYAEIAKKHISPERE